MADGSRQDHYAQALFEIAKGEGSLETVENELFKVARTIEGSDELRNTLNDAAIPLERRIGIVQDVFRTAHPTTLATTGESSPSRETPAAGRPATPHNHTQ